MAQRRNSDIDSEKLIELVKGYECLYNSRILFDKKDSVIAWKTIAKEMDYTRQDAVDQLKTRWRTLRDNFVKKKNANKQRLAAGEEELTWRYWEAMKWITPYLRSGRRKPVVELPSYARADLRAIGNQLSSTDVSNDGVQLVDYYADVYDDLELGDTAANIKSEPQSVQFTCTSSHYSDTVERDSNGEKNQIHTGHSVESVASLTISLPPPSKVDANNAPNGRKRPHNESDSSHNSKDNGNRAHQARFVSQASNFAYEVCTGLHHIKGEYERELAKRAIRDILFKARFPPHLYGKAAQTAPHNPSTSQPPTSTQPNSDIDRP